LGFDKGRCGIQEFIEARETTNRTVDDGGDNA
jgi:hypothetical protein